MQIINNYSNKLKSPNFSANQRTVFDKFGKHLYDNNSYYLRTDIKWGELVSFLAKKYKNAGKVNVYSLACSEGAEPFSLAMMLTKKLGIEKARKFFPIIASDFDEFILKNPRQGIVRLSENDVSRIEKQIGDMSKFIELPDKTQHYDAILSMTAYKGHTKPLLNDAVMFKNADIRSVIATIKPDNSIVLCRNVWPYIPEPEHSHLAQQMFDQLGENSMLVIGDFDYWTEPSISHKLIQVGFKPLATASEHPNASLIYLRPSEKEKAVLTDPVYLKSIYTRLLSR